MAVMTVELGERSYPIYVGAGLLQQSELLRRHIRASEVMLVTNEVVAPLYLERVVSALPEYDLSIATLPDGERQKNSEQLNKLYDEMLEKPCSRQTTVIALGGGVVGDIAGFAAASYQRGIDFIQIPTTLLAQVDSAVGGKTAINHPRGKNMIGAFHQPRCVITDTDTLATLNPRELSAGFAEVVKYAVIGDGEFFSWLEQHVDDVVSGVPDAMEEVILVSCRHKARFVADDERETRERVLLNLGHTFGHAIESIAGYGQWLHGEAVAVGMVMAADMSRQLGWMSGEAVHRIGQLLTRAHLPVSLGGGFSTDAFLRQMMMDKKVMNGRIQLVLPETIGRARLVTDYPDQMLRDVLESYCSG